MYKTESTFIKHISCDHCGSSDGCALYTDGHTYCFACGTIESESSQEDRERWKEALNRANAMKTEGEVKPIPDRGITRKPVSTTRSLRPDRSIFIRTLTNLELI